MSVSSTTKIVRVVGGLTAAGALMLTAACGSTGTGSVASAGNASDPMAAFTECMTKQGVTLPNPGRAGAGRPTGKPTGRPSAGAPTGPPTDAPTARPTGKPSGMPSLSADQQKAMQTCASLRPQGGPGGPGGPGGAPGAQNGQSGQNG